MLRKVILERHNDKKKAVTCLAILCVSDKVIVFFLFVLFSLLFFFPFLFLCVLSFFRFRVLVWEAKQVQLP